MEYSFEQFKQDVIAEATALKAMATPEELEMLNFEDLDPQDPCNCIYGQMAGSCSNLRASELIFGCCRQYINHRFAQHDTLDAIIASASGPTIEGVVDGNTLKEHRDLGFTLNHYSSIEAYIMIEGAKNAELISFLRGETDTLEL